MPVPKRSDFEAIQAVIAFRAPSPSDKPVDREEYGRGNFIWRRYRLWFQRKQRGEDKFYVYQTDLNSNGTELRPGKPIVVESDSKGTYDPEKETADVRVSEIEGLFPKWFGPKGPKLFPDDAVTYVNTEEGKNYDKRTFLDPTKGFLNESYIVVDKTPTLRNIKGEPVGVKIPKEKNVMVEKRARTYGVDNIRHFFRRCVRAAKERDDGAFSGGFDIMQQFQKKERKKQLEEEGKKSGQNDPEYFERGRDVYREWKSQGTGPKIPAKPFSSGFDILRRWQMQHGAKPETKPSEFMDGFDIMRQWQRRHRKVDA